MYQKRQWGTNVCCVTLCPMLMILVSWGLGLLVESLILSSLTYKETLFCSNASRSSIVSTPGSQVPGSMADRVYHSAYPKAQYEPAGCVYWMGQSYLYSPPLEPAPALSFGISNKDSYVFHHLGNSTVHSMHNLH